MQEPEKMVSQAELDNKAQKLVEEKDADSRLRVYVGPMEKILVGVLLIWAVFQVWANMFGTLGAVKLRTAHIMFLLPLAFTLYPTFKKERRRRKIMPVWDIALIAAAILSYGYLFMRYDAVAKTGRLNPTDIWVGVVCLIVAFEAARRASGNLAIIALIFLSYFAVWGRYIPGTFGTSAFTLKRVIKALVWEGDGFLLLYKRLEAGTFKWPRKEDDLKNLTYEQFSRLLQGFTIEPGIKKITPPESML